MLLDEPPPGVVHVLDLGPQRGEGWQLLDAHEPFVHGVAAVPEFLKGAVGPQAR